jgi:hypothetical protein
MRRPLRCRPRPRGGAFSGAAGRTTVLINDGWCQAPPPCLALDLGNDLVWIAAVGAGRDAGAVGQDRAP